MTDHDAEMDAIVADLERAGLVEAYRDAEGREADRLTKKGEPVARAIAMTGEEGQAVIDALLDEQEADPGW